MKATISSKGQIVLPAEIRRRDDIKPGEEFDIERLDQGEYSLTRKTRRRNRGLVQILLNCPVKGWYKPMERMTYLKISAMFASVLCMLASTQTTAGQGEFSRTIPYPNPQAASSGPHLLLPFDWKIVLLTDPPDSKVYVMDGLDGSVILEFLIPPNSTP
ncbi:AbrB/MazE/SpoVT family DNA-binding domain-containing protein, partial [Candidatus Sumerlaeota bacterium]|nr:AbrB/MazE/SpoVT family DNA-binding domain-containing protein [Candidatus Sumerlaeota bacterium]